MKVLDGAKRILAGAVLAATLALHAACDGDIPLVEPGPEPGTLAVTLRTDASDDGAVVFRLAGEGLPDGDPGELRPAGQELVIFPVATEEGWTVAVVGSALSGELVRFDVPDVGAAAAYEVVLAEVADEANEVRDDLSGHRLELTVVR